jgi:dolichyl-phosphate-mannose-protein mannosyltransferase
VPVAIEEHEIASTSSAADLPDDTVGPPESSRLERLIAAALFVVSFLYLCLFRRATWIDLDEGIILQGAQRILDGQVLYRDFFSFFTPGSYYLLALVFRVFGDSYLVAHTLLAVVGAGFSPVTYLLSRRVCGRQTSLLVTGLMTITALPLRFVILHNWDSTLLVCLALYCAVRLLESSSTKWAFSAASFASLTVLFEQSKGAGLVLGLGVGFAIVILYGQGRHIFHRRHLTAIAFGFLWPLLITFVYFASQHALGEMLKSWFWPIQHYSAANRVPYGYENMSEEDRRDIFGSGSLAMRLLMRLIFSPHTWIPYLPLLAVALLIRLMLFRNRRGLTTREWSYYVLISAGISGLLLSVIAARADDFHFLYLQPIFFLCLAWLLDGRNVRSTFVAKVSPVVGFLLSMSLLAAGAEALFQTRQPNIATTRRGTIATPRHDEVIPYIQAQTFPAELLLVYPYQATYYYLTQTYSPTSFEYYQPGMHTPEQVQEMLTQIKERPPRFVLYEPSFTRRVPTSWPNTPETALAVDPIASFLAQRYRACLTLQSSTSWNFLLMVRKDWSCPDTRK